MNKDRLALILVLLGLSVLFYLVWVVDTYRPVVEQNQPGILPKKEVVNNDYELPKLSDEENAATDSLFKSYVKESEEKSESESIETMREEVIKILNQETEDDTVTISFNMQWTPSWIEQ